MDPRRLGYQQGEYLAITQCKDQSGTKKKPFPDLPISSSPPFVGSNWGVPT